MSTRDGERATTIMLEMCENERDFADPIEEFQSALILAYETALEQGISPSDALAVILELASSEIQRLITPHLD
jgi:hypothetical protein